MTLLRDLTSLLAGGVGATPHDPLVEVPETTLTPAPTLLAPDFLKSMCESQDQTPEFSRLSEETDYLHVSALTNFCARQYALARLYGVVIKESPIIGSMRIIWRMGLALEDHVVRNLSAQHEGRVLEGFKVQDEDCKVSGRPDVVLLLHEDTGLPVEIKSMNARDFGKLNRPLGDHVTQVGLYHWLLSRNPLVHTKTGEKVDVRLVDEVAIMYVAKDAVKGSPYKEFHVSVRDKTLQTNVRLAIEGAKELQDHLAAGRIPRRRDAICDSPGCTRSKSCPVAALCWNMPKEGT